MLINLKTSEANKTVVQELSRKLQFGTENIISRMAFAYSLAQRQKLDPGKDMRDSKGKEYKDDILFGSRRTFYIALICQFYGMHKSDPNIGKYVKMHVDHGLELLDKLFRDSKNYTGVDFLIEAVDRGVESLKEAVISNTPILNPYLTNGKGYYSQKIDLELGSALGSDEPVVFHWNDMEFRNNSHIAVAGNSGTGKTHFAKKIIRQIVQKSHGQVNYIFLDFKGLKKDDQEDIKPFLEETLSQLVDAPHKPFPINPIGFINTINETDRILGINKLVDIISNYSGLGKKQELVLKEAVREAFQEVRKGQHPSFAQIREIVRRKEEGKPSKLTEIMDGLGELDLFDRKETSADKILNSNMYISLSGDLPADIRFTAVFLIINYLYNSFMNMANAPIENGAQSMRYLLVIDEAHVIFKQKKAQELLESMLREIRSKGVSVMLLSQGIEEFNQPIFDFSSMCETAFLFDIKDKTNLKMMQKFLGLGDKEAQKLKASMEKIQKYQLVSNIKEYKVGELFKV